MSKLGGIKAGLGPFFEFSTPYLLLYFFLRLSRILKRLKRRDYRTRLLKSLKEFYPYLKAFNEAKLLEMTTEANKMNTRDAIDFLYI